NDRPWFTTRVERVHRLDEIRWHHPPAFNALPPSDEWRSGTIQRDARRTITDSCRIRKRLGYSTGEKPARLPYHSPQRHEEVPIRDSTRHQTTTGHRRQTIVTGSPVVRKPHRNPSSSQRRYPHRSGQVKGALRPFQTYQMEEPRRSQSLLERPHSQKGWQAHTTVQGALSGGTNGHNVELSNQGPRREHQTRAPGPAKAV